MTQNEENTPKPPEKPPLPAYLVAKLEELIREDHSILPMTKLVEQAQILDVAFRRSVHRAFERGVEVSILQVALKAQNQYRQTIKALEPWEDPPSKRR